MGTEGRTPRVRPFTNRLRTLVLASITVAIGVTTIVVTRRDPASVVIERPTLVVRESGIWVSQAELAALPVTGPAWDLVAEYALDDWGEPALDDQNSNHDVHTLAGALYAARLDDPDMRARVIDALTSVEGSSSDEILALARNLLSYVIAADVIGYRSDSFDAWLTSSLTRPGSSRAGIDTLLESALRDPNNHGTHARASVVAVARYLGDDDMVGRVASRFHDWLGRSSADFEWRGLDWQGDPDRPRGINAVGAEIRGVNVDGVLPEEERRSGGFTDPPPQERYVWEALQGTVATAKLLDRAGFDVWEWEDRAILRAFVWLHDENRYPAEGDDRWIPWIVNASYGTDFPAETPAQPGKNVGFTDWTDSR